MSKNIKNYRWTICALLFFATTINYLDRQVLSLLQNDLTELFGWTNSDYANITAVFQFGYAISMLFAGRIIDKLGTKKGFTWAIIIWSIGAIIHAFSIEIGQAATTILGMVGITGFGVSVVGFMISRLVLAFGEAGNFPAAIKATAEYFPKSERAFATGIFNSGANIGAILAPLTVPYIGKKWGWEWAFIIVGLVGFVWLIFWLYFYEKPTEQKRLSKEELDYILSDSQDEVQEEVQEEVVHEKVKWTKLLQYKQTWSFALGKFLTDGVWWFYLFWLPSYLKAQYGLSKTDISMPLTVLYSMTMIGSIFGGWFPNYFFKKGYSAYDGRLKAMLVIALIPLIVLLAQPLGETSYWIPVIFIGIGASAHQAWSANLFTTVSDMFPKKSIATIVGIGGMAGGMGGVLVSKVAGYLFDKYKAIGIQNTWEKANQLGLNDYLNKIRALDLKTKIGEKISLEKIDFLNMPTDVVDQLKQVDSKSYDVLAKLQSELVLDQMTTSYTIVFVFCALAYIIAWFLMKSLVPKYKPITDL